VIFRGLWRVVRRDAAVPSSLSTCQPRIWIEVRVSTLVYLADLYMSVET
jgi:hypothetical protein